MSKRKKKQQELEEGIAQLQPGEKLRLAREAHELSVSDVSVRLKLGIEKINALERGDIEGLAAPVFVAGYLRTYARLLDLSETEVLADFDELLPTPEAIADPALMVNDETYGKVANDISNQFSLRDKSSGSQLGMTGVAGVVVLALVYFLWPSAEVIRTNVVNVKTENIAPVVSVATDVAVATDEAMGENVEQAEDRQNPVAELSTEVGANKIVVAEVTEVTEVTNVTEVTLEPVATGMKSELTLSFNGDSWAEVKDARGQRLVYRLGKSGSMRVVTGFAPFMVQLGYVQGVDILYNGAVYDLSKYENRRSVRLYIGKAGDRMGDE